MLLGSTQRERMASLRALIPLWMWGDLGPERFRYERKGGFKIRLNNFRNASFARKWTLQVVHEPTNTLYGAECSFDPDLLDWGGSEDDLVQTVEDDLVQAVKDTVIHLCQTVAPRMYHLDPRIGTPFSGVNGEPMDLCPLFDRPDGAGQTQEGVMRTILPRMGQDGVLREARIGGIPARCPFCQESLLFPVSGKAVVWGGGALCWTHKECLPA